MKAAFIFGFVFLVASNLFADDLSRLLETPDFTKTHVKIPHKGAGHCGPSAVSNSLVYLVKKGKLDKILDKTTNTPLLQWELVILLGSNQYMKTESEGGTSPKNLMLGLDRFMSSHAKGHYKIILI